MKALVTATAIGLAFAVFFAAFLVAPLIVILLAFVVMIRGGRKAAAPGEPDEPDPVADAAATAPAEPAARPAEENPRTAAWTADHPRATAWRPGDGDDDRARDLATQWARRTADRHGLELVRIGDPGPLVVQLMSAEDAARMRALPVSMKEGTAVIAVLDPDEHGDGSHLSELLGMPVRLVVAAADDMQQAMDLRYGGSEEARGPVDFRRSLMGDILISHGAATPQQVDDGLRLQEESGGQLGDLLVHAEVIDEYDVLRALAELHDLPAVDLGAIEPDADALAAIPEEVQRELRIVPLHLDDHGLLVACADRLRPDVRRRLAEHTSEPIREALATPGQIADLLQRMYSAAYSRTAVDRLQLIRPELSGHVVATGVQKAFLAIFVIAVVVLLVLFPIVTLAVLFGAYSVFHLAVSGYKLRLILMSLGQQSQIDVTPEDIAALDDRELPRYTILVPLFHEADVVGRLVDGVHGLDYPRHLLDVRLLCEEEDDETIEAIRALDLPSHFHLVVVPDSLPKTKPKACNFGLIQATGDITVIYDAEDRPDPQQLKTVVAAFRKAAPEVTCIQAKLNYFNAEQNLLTRWFTAEYSTWFDLMLPGLDAVKAPIPLGGTSNHFRTQELIELGAWDPFNVTEDADLGIRLSRAGLSTAVVDSTTYEEANSDLSNWIRQRSRWIKGYLQTYLVHMRSPLRLLRELGLRRFLSFQLVVGGTLTFLVNPLSWILTTLFTLTQLGFIQDIFPGFVYYAAITQLIVGNFIFTYANIAGVVHRGYFRLVRTALFTPIYWGFMSMAAWKGFLQLITNPFYWEKTVHGLDSGASPAAATQPASLPRAPADGSASANGTGAPTNARATATTAAGGPDGH
ncbi:MAG: glycosyltransferase [Solirubrobacteraceae bacterium]|nr:glycosyltransferase [Solirubrobacteraceae bacterium]